ncbi:calcium-binding protein, partial [Accumulibacter sp.]|uniref:calcium-binding protein n=1 Tax=Accumulibacter sp. TaxID=2053492 RepID=UPI0028C498A8
ITGSAGDDFIIGGAGSDTLRGLGGIDILQGGDGNDTLNDVAGSNLLDGGLSNDTLSDGAGNSLLVGGAGNDALFSGNGNDVIAFNKGDGYDSVTLGAGSKTLSLGGSLAYSDLRLRKSGNDLVLDTGARQGMAFKNWYVGTANQTVLNLQIVAEAMADFDAGSADPLLNQKVQEFDFTGLAAAFDAAREATPGLTSWALINGLSTFHLAASDTAALGGDLAYQYGQNGTLAGIGATSARQVIGEAGFGTQAQVLRPLAGLQEGARLS